MIPVSNAWYCRNFYTENFSSAGVPAGAVPNIDEYWTLDLNFSNWDAQADHSISFQTERFEGAVDRAMEANRSKPVSSGKGKVVKDSTFPDRPPQQMSGMGFDAVPNLTVKGYVIDQGIRAGDVIKATGMTLGAIALFYSPIPGTFVATQSKNIELLFEKWGWVSPQVY